MKTIESLIDEAWSKLFEGVCELDDNFIDLVIEYKGSDNGKTIRRSWKDRDERLRSEENTEKS